MNKEMTVEEFKQIPFGEIFGTGFVTDSPDGVNMTGSGRLLRWVAKKGAINDWAIYLHFAENSIEYVRDDGDKTMAEKHIRKLIPCTDEVFNFYRY